MVALLWLVLVVGLGVAALLVQGVAVLLAVAMPRLDPRPPDPGRSWPSVGVVIAARNEEEDLGPCLDDLLAQDYPGLDIVVVDGGSSDRTREVARARAPRVRLLEEPPLPPGWVGKSWACETGQKEVRGDWILFADADIRAAPSALRAALEWGQEEKADLVTLAPRFETGSFWERVILPFYAQMVLTYFRTPRVNRPDSRAAMANGQFTLVRRAGYEAVGGHRAVRTAVLEDVALARRYRSAGRTMRVAWAPDLLSTRMYRDRHEMFEGLLKNVHGTHFSSVRQGAFLAGLVAFFWLPFAILPVGLLAGSPWVAGFGLLLAVLLFVKHVAFARGLRTPAAYGLLFPIAVGFYVVLLATSLARGARGDALRWKGRRYALER